VERVAVGNGCSTDIATCAALIETLASCPSKAAGGLAQRPRSRIARTRASRFDLVLFQNIV